MWWPTFKGRPKWLKTDQINSQATIRQETGTRTFVVVTFLLQKTVFVPYSVSVSSVFWPLPNMNGEKFSQDFAAWVLKFLAQCFLRNLNRYAMISAQDASKCCWYLNSIGVRFAACLLTSSRLLSRTWHSTSAGLTFLSFLVGVLSHLKFGIHSVSAILFHAWDFSTFITQEDFSKFITQLWTKLLARWLGWSAESCLTQSWPVKAKTNYW